LEGYGFMDKDSPVTGVLVKQGLRELEYLNEWEKRDYRLYSLLVL